MLSLQIVFATSQDNSLVTVLQHKGIKLLPIDDSSECYVTFELTFIEFIQEWSSFLLGWNCKLS